MEKAQLSDNPASTKQLHGTSTPHMHFNNKNITNIPPTNLKAKARYMDKVLNKTNRGY